LNVYTTECHLDVRVPHVGLSDGSVRMVEPAWAGQPNGFTLLFEPLVLAMCKQMLFSAVVRIVGLSWRRVRDLFA
jgi:hypothetical protein